MPSRLKIALLAVLAAVPVMAAEPSAAPAVPSRFTWVREDGSTAWRVSLDTVRSGTSASLSAPVWFPQLPDGEIGLFDGGAYSLASARGRVLLLEFWASWCSPCLHELPHLESFYRKRQQDGLEVLAVNAMETETAARSVVRGLGLTFPVGRYDDVVDRVFRVRALPTMVLADRAGRVRARWDSQVPDFEREVVPLVNELLGEGPRGSERILAEVIEGSESLRAWWVRDLGQRISGVAVLSTVEGPAWAAVGSGRQLLAISGEGEVRRRIRLAASAGRLRARPGGGEVVSFHPGGTVLERARPDDGSTSRLSSPAPVLDATWLAESDRLVLATTEGMLVAAPLGPPARWEDAGGPTRDVAAVGRGSGQRLVALTSAGMLRWFDPSGRKAQEAEAPPGTVKIIASKEADASLGTVPRLVTAVAVGSFWGEGRQHAALATSADDLIVIDLADGAVRFRARWEGVTDLASGDLDGDGQDELVVGFGSSLAVLSPRPGPAPQD